MSLVTQTKLLNYPGSILRVDPENPEPFNTIPTDHVNGSSIDVRLGKHFWIEDNQRTRPVRLARKESIGMTKVTLDWGQEFILQPGQFILAETVEVFYMPAELSAEFRLKSSIARSALDQSLAVWCDPWWHGSNLTLELRNCAKYHPLVLEVGMKLGQMVFFEGEPVPHESGYAMRGQYNNDKGATPSKGVR